MPSSQALHGVGLDSLVGVVAADAGFGQGEHDALAVDQAVGGFEVGLHAVGVDDEAVDDPGEHVGDVVEGEAGVGDGDALGGGVGDVALVPEGDVFERGHGVGADGSGESADALGLLRVALVGHRGGAGLALGEGLADLADLGPLEVADLGGEALERGGDHGEGGEEVCVSVALDDLGRDRLDAESELAADALLDVRRDGRVGADGAGDLADGDGLDRVGESASVAAGLVDPARRA